MSLRYTLLHTSPMFDKFKDECGVFGVLNHRDAANIVYLGLYALQHRGQESAGIASVSLNPVRSEANIGTSVGSSGAGEQIIAPGTPQIHVEKEMGHVADVFGPDRLARLPGQAAIGHVATSPLAARCSATPNRSSPPRAKGGPSSMPSRVLLIRTNAV